MMGGGHNVESNGVETRLWLTIGVAVAVSLVELVGGTLAHSLSLISDSGHVFTDILAIGVSIFGIRLARRPHSARWSFGYHRAEIFAALANGGVLFVVALLIISTAYLRALQPVPVQGTLTVLFASVGLAGNLVMALVLSHGGRDRHQKSLNLRGALFHVLGDALSSIGVIASGLIVVFTGYLLADPIVAVLISVLIVASGFSLVRDSVNILGEATPKHLKLETVARTVSQVEGVKGIHDLHIWTISSGLYALSGHLIVDTDNLEEGSRIIRDVSHRLADEFGIEHVTLQLERQVLQEIERPTGTPR